ncbi:3'(2'),5'-bisphosphate nucleotidase CysQ [Shewanella zhangzhouensis]|uniref:3'(2'),5'-bisphosphate nucleotidase CysQ n=1 Tax=Shewanella zhangzhouensis TaxID=2864213 RepID=UPI001C65C77D|nr:3'(2'),5'-bisphosphate nucleotidase CysQ [Shewanella zhangzhouensis]QYK03900.1 3'(2'),5'-bisphosphate nucleotidase CysQ [Shewanella zhangzhouensis]
MTLVALDKTTLDRLGQIARQAGAAIMAVYGQDDVAVTQKSDDSPVTAADLASHTVIIEQLAEAFPHTPVLSEEAVIDWESRRQWQEYFLIDPLDGTKEFIKRNGEFTVNIALVRDGVAVAGVVFAPVLDTCYLGANGLGAWLERQGEQQPLQGCAQKREVPVVVGSRSHQSAEMAGYLAELGDHELLSVGSSLKFCMLAEGRADLYPRLGPTSEWDTAAAQAVLESAGGRVVVYGETNPLVYNKKEQLLNPWFMATAPGWNGD